MLITQYTALLLQTTKKTAVVAPTCVQHDYRLVMLLWCVPKVRADENISWTFSCKTNHSAKIKIVVRLRFLFLLGIARVHKNKILWPAATLVEIWHWSLRECFYYIFSIDVENANGSYFITHIRRTLKNRWYLYGKPILYPRITILVYNRIQKFAWALFAADFLDTFLTYLWKTIVFYDYKVTLFISWVAVLRYGFLQHTFKYNYLII